jgi:hypothetical protein
MIVGISIGKNAKIKNSTIAENIHNDIPKKNFIERHPIIISVTTSFIVGFFLLFSFWKDIIIWIERVMQW